eukprot:TRINITY_DN15_c0_g1_i10.p1 TRINITY_DN15_c0_g1~~TRINITY_DN15_c0_g1_i10.p1  ORF type:complete len:298 (+),score=116.82 TRINITY_DN15_c0_g1_i10:75-968(+)
MMSRKMLLLASVGLVSLQMASAQVCSGVCNACCPPGANGEVLTPNLDGDCVDSAGKAVCYLESGRCLNGNAAVPCDTVHTPKMHLRLGGVGPNAGDAIDTVTTFLAEGTDAWDTLKQTALPGKAAQLVNVPPSLRMPAAAWVLLTPKATQVAAGNTATLQCSFGSACTVAIFLYECNPCESEKANLPALLVGDGFERTRCAPSFTNGRTDTVHRMTSYTKNLPVNGRYEFVAPGPIDFMMIAMSLRPTPECGPLDETACGNTAGYCAWRGRCERNTCVQQGPGGGCNTQTCVKKELA